MDEYPRESHELVPAIVTLDGAVVTTGVKLCVTMAYDGSRPTSFTDPIALDGKIGVWTDGFAVDTFPATMKIWAQVTDDPEIPAIDCGEFKRT